ncbi:MAG: cyclic nucleotide-binding domain-containing protein [Gammaproteobacteria bacterium]|nr:cyclic nucleotide-binding domain-containing protein [Gammaproteobacteria bacterium]
MSAAPKVSTSRPAFADLSPEDVDALFKRAVVRSFPKHAIIVNEGDKADSIYFILAGRVKIFLSNEEGREVVIGNIAAGDYFGEMSLQPGTRSASVMTVDASCGARFPGPV